MKTFLRWNGNKTVHLKHILPFLPDKFNTYIEPFIGSGALFLFLQPSKWIISDINKDLINIWNTVLNDPKYIISSYKKFGKKFIPLSKDDKLILCRATTNHIDEMSYDRKRAVSYLLMIHCVYQNTLTVNNRFYFNGIHPHIYTRDKYYFLTDRYYENIRNVSSYLQRSRGRIFNKDYKEVLKKAKEGDFVFLDPPYIEDHDYGFNYNKDEMLDKNFLNNLLQTVRDLDKKNVKWLMTQADTPTVRSLFREFKISSFHVYRSGSHLFKKELILRNY
jgi:DNA adenine methylase